MNGKIPRGGIIDRETTHPYDLRYQCSKYGP